MDSGLKKLIAILSLLQLVFLQAEADTYLLRDDKNNSFQVTKDLYIYKEGSAQSRFEEIEKSNKFKQHNQTIVPNFGFTEGSYWFKFTIKNCDVGQTRLVEFAYPFFDSLAVYIPDDKGHYNNAVVGDHFPFSKRWLKHKNFVFEIQFNPNEEKTIYAHITCIGEATSFPVNVWTKYNYLRNNYEEQLALGIYYGIVLFAFFLSALLWLIVREKYQLFYFFYIVGVGLFQFSLDGLAFEYFWPDNTWLANHIIPLSASFAIFFLILFSQSLLITRQFTPRIHNVLNVLLVSDALLHFASLFDNPFYAFGLKAMNFIALPTNIFIFIAAIIAYRKGLNSSKYFLIAFSLLLLGIVTALLKNFGIIPRVFITEYGIQIGSAIEIIMLSFALADALKNLKTSKQKVQAQLLEQLKEKYVIQQQANAELELKVDERTAEIMQQKEVIEEKNKDITDSINYAKKIQEAMLPSLDEIKASFNDCFVFYKPRDIVSGDFYWFTQKKDKIYIATADCTGHGVPGALMSMIGSSFLNEIVNEYNVLETSEILDLLRLKVIKTLRQRETHTKDGMDISICAIDVENKSIQFSGAFNPAYLVVENEGFSSGFDSLTAAGKTIVTIPADRFPIGIVEGRMNDIFETRTISYRTGDCIYLCTDGIADQFGGEAGKKFKTKQLKSLFATMSKYNMETQLIKLEDTFNSWKGNLEQVDDILVIGIRL